MLTFAQIEPAVGSGQDARLRTPSCQQRFMQHRHQRMIGLPCQLQRQRHLGDDIGLDLQQRLSLAEQRRHRPIELAVGQHPLVVVARGDDEVGQAVDPVAIFRR